MGQSTNGQICFGIEYGEEEMPWTDGEPDEWWITQIQGYKPPFKLFNSDGQYIDGVEPKIERISEYYDHRQSFLDKHPLPIEIVNGCSCDYEHIIIAVPSSVMVARRGYPVKINPNDLVCKPNDVEALIQFCKDYCPPIYDYTPHWWLSSLWC